MVQMEPLVFQVNQDQLAQMDLQEMTVVLVLVVKVVKAVQQDQTVLQEMTVPMEPQV